MLSSFLFSLSTLSLLSIYIQASSHAAYPYCEAPLPSSTSIPHHVQKYALVVLRHGDRTPLMAKTLSLPVKELDGPRTEIAFDCDYPHDDQDISLSKTCTRRGELTKKGWKQHVQIGEKLRELYVGTGLLPKEVIPGVIKVESTNYQRTKASAAAFLSGLYPSTEHTSKITSTATADFMLTSECPHPGVATFEDLLTRSSHYSAFMNEQKPTRDYLASLILALGIDQHLPRSVHLTTAPLNLLMDPLRVLKCHQHPFPMENEALKVGEMWLEAYQDMVYRGVEASVVEDYMRGSFGRLFAEMREVFQSVIKRDGKRKEEEEKVKEKMRVWVGHDDNVYAILAGFKAKSLASPPYASSFQFELYKYSPLVDASKTKYRTGMVLQPQELEAKFVPSGPMSPVNEAAQMKAATAQVVQGLPRGYRSAPKPINLGASSHAIGMSVSLPSTPRLGPVVVKKVDAETTTTKRRSVSQPRSSERLDRRSTGESSRRFRGRSRREERTDMEKVLGKEEHDTVIPVLGTVSGGAMSAPAGSTTSHGRSAGVAPPGNNSNRKSITVRKFSKPTTSEAGPVPLTSGGPSLSSTRGVPTLAFHAKPKPENTLATSLQYTSAPLTSTTPVTSPRGYASMSTPALQPKSAPNSPRSRPLPTPPVPTWRLKVMYNGAPLETVDGWCDFAAGCDVEIVLQRLNMLAMGKKEHDTVCLGQPAGSVVGDGI